MLQGVNEVFAGLHKLPGASIFEKPSIKIATTKSVVDANPRSEAYERSDSGTKTVGIILEVLIY
jgi:hypothetical protein